MTNVDKIKVEKQAKEILDKFAKALQTVEKDKEDNESYVEREEFERVEKQGKTSEEGFKERILKNAPAHDDDFIIAEKGSWK
ncbi:MAG: hypothetical protein WC979_09340 [Candidatus Pacearchaeota archaeon]|jgi:predicted Asp-tRNA(Asn)/Glu-tRNA(Gln) amidotransferase subunit C